MLLMHTFQTKFKRTWIRRKVHFFDYSQVVKEIRKLDDPISGDVMFDEEAS